MIRTIVTPKDQTISFDIPKKYIGKQIEIIAFSKDEEIAKETSVQKKVSFNALAMDTRNYKFNRDEANER
jgi:uncharacterized membrane protein YfhO